MLLEFDARVSSQEMRRRYDAVRRQMREKKFETLLVSGVRFINSTGYLRYLTNWGEHFNGEYLLFPLKGKPLFFTRTNERAIWIRRLLHLQVKVGSTASTVSQVLKERKIQRIGLCSPKSMMADFYIGLTKSLPDCQFEDATSILDNVRRIKSKEELGWVRKSASLADSAFEMFTSLVSEGVAEHDVFSQIDYFLKSAGAESTYFLTHADPQPVMKFMDMTTDHYQKNDLVLFSAELSGPGGYYTQLIRTVSVGKPTKEAVKAFRVCTSALLSAEKLLKPGTKTIAVYNKIRSVIENAGYTMNLHPGHSQGLDVFEQPVIDGKNNDELRAGMIIVLQPQVTMKPGGNVWLGETYLVTDRGAERLNKSSRSLRAL